LPVRTLTGVLRWPAFQEGSRPAALGVELLDGRTGRLLRSTRTGAGGAFHLPTPAPGRYVLRVTPPGSDSGEVPIVVDPGAAPEDLDLEFGSTSCGVSFVAHHACPREEIRISGFRGQVLDGAEAPIGRAALSVFSGNGEEVERLVSDEMGRFDSGGRLAGNYELTVRAPGFTTLRQKVHVTPAVGGARAAAMRIELGVLGACSQAVVR
jgi:hypothetical protein